jgi:hypothetical protein
MLRSSEGEIQYITHAFFKIGEEQVAAFILSVLLPNLARGEQVFEWNNSVTNQERQFRSEHSFLQSPNSLPPLARDDVIHAFDPVMLYDIWIPPFDVVCVFVFEGIPMRRWGLLNLLYCVNGCRIFHGSFA